MLLVGEKDGVSWKNKGDELVTHLWMKDELVAWLMMNSWVMMGLCFIWTNLQTKDELVDELGM